MKVIKLMLSIQLQPLSKQGKTSASLEDLLAQTSLLPIGQNGERGHASIERRALSKTPSKSSCQEISLDIEDNRSRHIDGTYRSLKEDSVNCTPSSYSGESLDFSRGRSSDSEHTIGAPRSKKRVNILTNELPPSKEKLCSSSISFDNSRHLDSRDASLINITSESDRSVMRDNYLTMTGTIKRGRQKGQSVDLQLNMSRDELEKINQAALLIQQAHDLQHGRTNCCCGCSLTSGMHIFLLSLISLPFVMLVTSVYAFYIGTLTWYNMFTYFNEEKPCLYRVFMSPLLVVAYPFVIVLCTIGLGIYSGLVQISTTFAKWSNEIADIEKGFYGWLCSFLHLSDCSPYEVVILTDLKAPDAVLGNTSTEELSL